MSWTVAVTNGNHYQLYTSLEEQSGRKHERRCINGKITGSGQCVGYCLFQNHPGFLTEDLQKKHRCEIRDCRFFLPKPQKLRNLSGQI